MKDAWHESFKWSLLIDTAIETVRKHKQEYLLSRYGVPEPSQRWPPTRKRKEIQK